jgi:HdeA/HdeB family
MHVSLLMPIVMAALLAAFAPLLSAEADLDLPLRKFQITKLTCEEVATMTHRLWRESLLVYMNGYVDGTRKAGTWDAEVVSKRIDEALRICADNPKLPILDAFNRAWSR